MQVIIIIIKILRKLDVCFLLSDRILEDFHISFTKSSQEI